MNWVFARWVLAIWNPDRMNFIRCPKRRAGRCLFYRAKGIVLHDRCLADERMSQETQGDSA